MSRVNTNQQGQDQGQDLDQQNQDQDQDIVLSSDDADNADVDGQDQGQVPWVLDNDNDPMLDYVEGQQQDQGRQDQDQGRQQQQQQQSQDQGQPQQSQSGQMFEVRLPTGQVFRGRTADEANNAAIAFQQKLSSAMPAGAGYDELDYGRQQQRRHDRDDLPPLEDWDKEKFWKKFAEDPMEAMEDWARHYFGVDDPREALSTSYTVSQQVSDRIAAAEFLNNNPDFPASPESANLVMRRVMADGVSPTAYNLEVAYRRLVREGLLVPVQSDDSQGQPPQDSQGQGQGQGQQQGQQGQQYRQTQQGQHQQQQRRSRGTGAPPSAPDRGSDADAGAGNRIGDRVLTRAEFEELSADQMKEYMERRRAMGDRSFSHR